MEEDPPTSTGITQATPAKTSDVVCSQGSCLAESPPSVDLRLGATAARPRSSTTADVLESHVEGCTSVPTMPSHESPTCVGPLAHTWLAAD